MKFSFVPNPVALREIRQMVRNKFVSVGLILYLFVQLIAVMLTVVSETDSNTGGVSLTGKGIGSDVAFTVSVILVLMTLGAIPMFTGIRMTLEKNADNMDLQFATTLRPVQFADGKFISSIVLFMLVASSSLPFLMLAYILRGLDLGDVLLYVGIMTVFAMPLFHVAIFIGTLGTHKAFRFALLGTVVWVATVVFFGFGVITLNGFGPGFESWDFKYMILVAVCVCFILRGASAAQLAPPHTEGSFLLRNSLIVAWFVWGAAAAGLSLWKAETEYIVWWFGGMCAMLNFLLFTAVSSKSGMQRRIAPHNGKRSRFNLRFLFLSCAESGVLYSLILSAITGYIMIQIAKIVENKIDDEGIAAVLFVFCYPAAYMITMRLIWHAVLRRITNCKYVGLLALLLMLLGSVLPYLLTIGNDSANPDKWFGNMNGAFDALTSWNSGHDIMEFHMCVSAVWLTAAILLYTPYIISSFRRYRKSGKEISAIPKT